MVIFTDKRSCNFPAARFAPSRGVVCNLQRHQRLLRVLQRAVETSDEIVDFLALATLGQMALGAIAHAARVAQLLALAQQRKDFEDLA